MARHCCGRDGQPRRRRARRHAHGSRCQAHVFAATSVVDMMCARACRPDLSLPSSIRSQTSSQRTPSAGDWSPILSQPNTGDDAARIISLISYFAANEKLLRFNETASYVSGAIAPKGQLSESLWDSTRRIVNFVLFCTTST